MKLFQKIFILFSSTICFLGCESTTIKQGSLIDYIPENAKIVFKVQSIDRLTSDIKNNDFITAFDETSPFSFFSEEASLLKHLHPAGESVIAISEVNDSTTVYTYITKQSPTLFVSDSIKDKTIETLTYGDKAIQRVTIAKKTAFTAIQDSVFIASSSQQILEGILDKKTLKEPTFAKVYGMNTTADFSILLRANAIPVSDSTQLAFANWTALKTQVLPDRITATGVSLARDSIPQLLSVFEGQIPQQNDIENITPREASEVVSFTFNDTEKLIKNLKSFRREETKIETNGLFDSASEIAHLALSTGNAVVLKSIDPLITKEALARFISEKESFREVVLFDFNQPELCHQVFAPLLPQSSLSTVFQIENFFVFTETEGIAQQIISAYKNNDCLNKTPYFESAISDMSNASSLLIFKMKSAISPALATFFGNRSRKEIAGIQVASYPLVALQFSYDRDFAHVNLVCKSSSEKVQTAGTVSEQFNVKLDEPVMGNPVFFSNYTTREKDIAVQDIANTLYLLSNSGKTLWKNKLDGPILGQIQEVDLLKNGRKQLAFVTKNTFYVLDRKGKTVKPFPLKFKDPITQPLAIFDYDNKRNYRFVITQGKEVYMYDNEAKIVKGFTFKAAKSDITLAPEHLRLGNKDYIVIAESNGTLNILSRVGKSRVSVKEKINFSDTPVMKEGNNFVIITKDNEKKSISQQGKVSTQKLDVTASYSFNILGNTKVTLDDNLLRINGVLVELPFGIYSTPSLFQINRDTYIAITETQENKVYVLDRAGKIVNGFPVYGTDAAHLGDVKNNKKVGIVVKGASNEILLYSVE